MKIKIEFVPENFDDNKKRYEQTFNVIFVKTEADKQKLHKLLCEQDESWGDMIGIDAIQILPSDSVIDETEIKAYFKWYYNCEMTAFKALKKQVDFIFYQC